MKSRNKLTDYKEIVGDDVIDEIFRKGAKVRNARVVMINSASQGGGVVEILRNLIPLLNDAGLRAGWRTLKGHPDFYRVTKRIHNSLQGEDIDLTEQKKKVYEGVNEDFAKYTHLGHHDLVVVHDPQPLPLVDFYRREQPWVWRCHIDLSNPNRDMWSYLKKFILPYDCEIYQLKEFARTSANKIVHPSIDPLSTKNKKLGEKTVDKYLEQIGIDPQSSEPLIVQVSRFDPWKDPLGVIESFDKVREEIDAQLLLVGSFAEDDPQAEGIYEEVLQKVGEREDITVAANLHDIAVNAVQRAADVVVQKSIREGFGLTVTEAMWKGTPVVGGEVGGIPKQIVDGETGYLADPEDYEEVAGKILEIIASEDLKQRMGEKAKKRVREEFLITRQIGEWLDIFDEML